MKQTDVNEFFNDLDGGVFTEKLGTVLSDVAAHVMDYGNGGKVTITLDMKRIGSSFQVGINHKLAYTKPTARGKISEESTTETPMHVGRGGHLSQFPENQSQLFGKKGESFDADTGEIMKDNSSK